MIGCCYIYCLRDPETKVAYYVGSTINPVLRFAQHTRHHCGSDALRTWIRGVQDRGGQPEFQILETILVAARDEREGHWIRFLLESGEPLLNWNLRPTYLLTRSSTLEPAVGRPPAL